VSHDSRVRHADYTLMWFLWTAYPRIGATAAPPRTDFWTKLKSWWGSPVAATHTHH